MSKAIPRVQQGPAPATRLDRSGEALSTSVSDRWSNLTALLAWPRRRKSQAAALESAQAQRDAALTQKQASAQRVRELEGAAKTAAARQARLLATVAHELRNPLGTIRAAAAILGRVKPEGSEQVQLIVEQQVAHMARMIDDLLDVSLADTGKLGLVLQQVQLQDIIHQAAAACSPALFRRDQRLEVSGVFWDCELKADPARLLQVLSNLLNNASKYSPAGRCIRLHIKLLRQQVVLSVSDDGIGIPQEALERVFEPFVQETQAVAFDRSGLGIGLAVVRELVESHGGSVSASSGGTGCGSQFDVILPRITRGPFSYLAG